MKRSTLVAIATAALALSGAVSAHPRLKTASPAPDAVLSASPRSIHITFGEGLIGKFSDMDVIDQAGKKADLGPSALNPRNNKELVAAVRTPLAPGAYTVNWRAVGDDTHHVSGHYSFQVKP
jgi:methionine-rich copper-binding protein CopC